jgi:hypothetical protein
MRSESIGTTGCRTGSFETDSPRASGANVDEWDGYYAQVAIAEGVNTVLTLDDDFERFNPFDTEVILSPDEFSESKVDARVLENCRIEIQDLSDLFEIDQSAVSRPESRRCRAGVLVGPRKRDVDFEAIVGQRRFLRSSRPAAFELDDADVFEFGEVSVDLLVIPVYQFGGFANGFRGVFGDRVQQFQVFRTEEPTELCV